MKNKKKDTGKKAAQKKYVPVKRHTPVYKNVLYLLPESVSAGELCKRLEFLPQDALEVWTELDILEITVESRTITFESLMEQLYGEELELLAKLSMKQVYICEYAEEDRELMRKIMQLLVQAFGGRIGSDTEDFEPFFEPEQL